MSWKPAIIALFWLVLFCAWTAALLRPIPPDAVQAVGGDDYSFWLGKTLHVGVYAFLAVLASRLPLSLRWRRLAVLVLLLHGGLTEFLQLFVQRGASFRDVGLDTLGTLAGVLVTWKRWFPPRSSAYGDGNLGRSGNLLPRSGQRGELAQEEVQDHGRRQNEDAADLG